MNIWDQLRDTYGEFYAYKAFESNVTQSFPCYGALLQVGVYPNPPDHVELHDFPYISAAQPSKREMYETVSQSGELGSQSATKLNVGKQMTNTDSVENYDLTTGHSSIKTASISDQTKDLSYAAQTNDSSSTAGQWGTIGRNQRLAQDVTNIEPHEKRESF